mgnify:CR=1 FL=1
MDMVEVELGMSVCRNGYSQPCGVMGLDRNTEIVRILPLPAGWTIERLMAVIGPRGTLSADAYKFPDVDKPIETVRVHAATLTRYTGPR